jgi:integrase
VGRKRKGYFRERNGRVEAEIAGEYLGSFDTRAEAERMVKAALNEDAGSAPDAFSLFASDWMDKRELAARKRKRSRPFEKERSRWRTHVVSAPFWDWPIKKIAQHPKIVQEWIGKLVETEAIQIIKRKSGVERRPTGRTLSRRVIEDALSLVKLCLDDAKIAGKYKGDNPARVAKLPRFEEQDLDQDGELIVHMSSEEIVALFALELPPLQLSVFTTAIYAGLRLDELWGLRWMDVVLDGDKPTIRVRRSYDGPLKTKYSRRDVPMLFPVRVALRAWKAEQSATPIGNALVWPRDDGRCHGESYTAGWRSKLDGDRHVRGWAEKAGVRPEIRFLDLRHTCGCHLVQGTWTPRPLSLHEVKRWLGHSSINVTERHYASLTSDNLHNAVATPGFPGYKPDALNDHTR